MSKNVDERGKNRRDWALMIPLFVVGTIATVVYGVACMAMWAARIVEGVKRV